MGLAAVDEDGGSWAGQFLALGVQPTGRGSVCPVCRLGCWLLAARWRRCQGASPVFSKGSWSCGLAGPWQAEGEEWAHW